MTGIISAIFVAFSVLLQTSCEENTETTVFVKSGATEEDGKTFEKPVGSFKKAYELLANTSESGLTIKVIKSDDETDALKAEVITFDKTSGITIEGVGSTDANEKVEIDCDAKTGSDLFTCKNKVSFKYLIFDITEAPEQETGELESNPEPFALIHAVAGTENEAGSGSGSGSGSESLTIETCEFKLPGSGGNIGIHLVKVSAGTLTMKEVECTDEGNAVSFTETPFLIDGSVTAVSLTSLTLSKITSTTSAVVKIVGKKDTAISVSLDSCTFTDCVSSDTTSGALYVESENADSTFTIGNTDETTFTKCTCTNGKSGGIYLKITGIAADKLSWPTTGSNLVFSGCAANSSRPTGLYLEVNAELHKTIADAMKSSFAADYTLNDNRWFVAAKGESDGKDVDFTLKYFDQPTEVFVKSEETGEGVSQDGPIGSLQGAYELLADTNEDGLFIKVIKADDGTTALKAEAITFGKASGITIMGVSLSENDEENDEENGEAKVIETEVEIDCDAKTGSNLFTCKKKVEFRSLAFNFPLSLEKEQIQNDDPTATGPFALITADGADAELSIVNCRFVRPTAVAPPAVMRSNEGEETVGIHLVKVSAGSLTMTEVKYEGGETEISFAATPFLVEGTASKVSLTSLNLKKITSSSSAVMKITSTNKIEVSLDSCTFTDCVSSDATSGALYVESENAESSFTIGDNGETKFENCTCENGKSGGISLNLKNITADKLSWPSTKEKLMFSECTAGEAEETSNSIKNTGLYLDVPVGLHEEIAAAMKKSFAADYKIESNKWFIAAKKDSNSDVDFVTKFIDLYDIAYAKKGGNGLGTEYGKPAGSISEAYNLLKEGTNSGGFQIKVIKDDNGLEVKAITLEKESPIMIEGVGSSADANEKVKIGCYAKSNNDLFTCKKEVSFRYLIFDFPTTLSEGTEELKANTNPSALIHAAAESTSLSIDNCEFARPTEGEIGIHLVKVSAGSLTMNQVECTSDDEVKFSVIPFLVEGAKKVVIEDVEVKKVEVEEGAAMSIKNGIKGEGKENKKNEGTEGTEETKGTIVVVEGLKMEEVKSKSGNAAGVEISLGEENSKVKMGRKKACTFKECKAENGKSGAIYIEMEHVSGNLELPGENKLEIDGTNSGKGTSGASLCIVAPDFDSFSKQDNAFEFAKSYDEGKAGWVVGAADENAEPVDVYEKYLKEKKEPEPEPVPEPEPEKKDERKTNTGVIAVAVVVPIVFVIAVVVIVIVVVVVVVKKRRSKHNSDGVGRDKEQEMSSNM
ncbi:uncharacterized protein MONOS_13306 [Monocercomonoides exilis]|uniref:uncharacterized protein n=1 Tax=Monocercomonoides exilis TaxID=2049356 RepID=UPI00355AC624|nr:hypothetical protein MONOS_13306 [Monocercomonoides exilis]